MKFIHIADMHFDKPFTILEKNGLSEERRINQRRVFNKMIQYIKDNNIEYLFIAGDLYEHEYIRKSTIDFINNCFKQIENTRIYIAPGNHDPYINNSYYNKYTWNENVRIFTELKKIEDNNINIYGYGFTNFSSKAIELPDDLNIDKINILLMHSDLNGSKEEGEHNPVLETSLNSSEFDYVALGHIHKKSMNNLKAVYPGSMFAGGFDELGEHGMIVGEIDSITKKVLIKFVPLDDEEFVKDKIDISNINSEEELIEYINNKECEDNKYYEYVLTGNRNFEIDKNKILKLLENNKVIRLKDISKFKIDLDKISKEKSLRGIYVNELLKEIDEDKSNKDEIYRIIEIGLNAMN